MLNYLWAGMMLLAIFCAAVTGRMEQLSQAVFTGAQGAVELVLSICGMMALWTGLLKIADEGGLTALLARALRPALSRLFPKYAPNSPAARAISMNITANLLGMGNAATPMGIAAMKEMSRLAPPGEADDCMVRFVVLNTASLQLVPTMVGALRQRYGAGAPFDVTPAVWAASLTALAVGLLAAFVLERRRG